MAGCFTYEITVRRVTRISRFTWYATLPLRFISLYSLQRNKLLVRASQSPGRAGHMCMRVCVCPLFQTDCEKRKRTRSLVYQNVASHANDEKSVRAGFKNDRDYTNFPEEWLRKASFSHHPSIFHSSSIIGTFTRGRLSRRAYYRGTITSRWAILMTRAQKADPRAEAKIKSHVFARIITSYARNHHYSHQKAIISDFAREWVLWWFVRFQGKLRFR